MPTQSVEFLVGTGTKSTTFVVPETDDKLNREIKTYNSGENRGGWGGGLVRPLRSP
jgi:hypothetical protein